MKIQLLIFIIFIGFISCESKKEISNSESFYLDSLLNFEPIVSIYSNSGLPLRIVDDEIEAEVDTNLYIDSTRNSWTNSIKDIDEIRKIFPKMVRMSPPIYWTTTCCGNQQLLFKTKKGIHEIYWLTHDGDDLVQFDKVIYHCDKKKLENTLTLLNRSIVLKEIYTKDTINYDLKDTYNAAFGYKPDSTAKTMFVYILK